MFKKKSDQYFETHLVTCVVMKSLTLPEKCTFTEQNTDQYGLNDSCP